MSKSTEKRKVLLGITGSIAAYKSVELARLLVTRGYEVRVVMTQSAQQFVGPITLQTVSQNPVVVDFWSGPGIDHIDLGAWADVVVVAPATADVIAKMAGGFADTPLLAALLVTRAPILVAPAMNCNMLEHAATQANVKKLIAQGVRVLEGEHGALACGWVGSGRMAEPAEIFYEVRRALSKQDLEGRRVVITTGPTREPLDPVRFLSNRSSGKMGVALASEAFRRGAAVTLIHGPVSVKVPQAVKLLPVVTADEMYSAVMREVFESSAPPDIVVMAAAVADFRPAAVSNTKIKKSAGPSSIELARNQDILSAMGERRGDAEAPILVGFAIETGELEDLLTEARRKLETKRADLIVGNFAEEAFDLDTNRVWLIDRTGRQTEVATTYKSRVAVRIFDAVTRLS